MQLVDHRGTNNPAWSLNGKLYEYDVRQIKAAIAMGERKSDLAREYGVSRQLIDKIANGQKWGWLK